MAKDIKQEKQGAMRLNKFVAHCGITSRRKAAELVKNGMIQVNGKPETNPAITVSSDDKVVYKGKVLKPVDSLVYLLINKPKGIITTVNDEKGRKTIIDVLRGKITQRVYPVGRLDKDTTGLLLLTNDGDLAEKLAHPRHEVKKIYQVKLDRPLKPDDMDTIQRGIKLVDGVAEVDKLSYINGTPKSEVGIELHSGKNRVIRRIFQKLQYKVVKLDRVYYAGLTKKDLPRGRFRHLDKREIIMLKHFI